MSVHLSIANPLPETVDKERSHRICLRLGMALAAALVIAIMAYGYDYYFLSAADRPYSPKHQLLRPSGDVGVKLGVLGVLIFSGIFLYPLRKKIPWLAKRGMAKHWLDYHVILGTTAPLVIAFHASFKFHGIAGMAFWIMTAVAISGIGGRYIYGQIPRQVNAAEMSLKELHELETQYSEQLSEQKTFSSAVLEPLFSLPSREEVDHLPALAALAWMIWLDLRRPFRIARLRMRVLGFGGALVTFGGVLRTRNLQLERVIDIARRKSTIGKRVLFLSRAQKVFHLWHVVHRPFSYSFAVLAVLHIVVAMLFGFM
jgi:hypothetical protein